MKKAFSFQLSAIRKFRKHFFLKAESWQLKASQKGFTLLLAALISSIVLALGAAIFTIAQKQITLSSIGRDSQFAFYAADTAAECALYWDFRCNYFATSTSALTPGCPLPADGQPVCNGKKLNATGRPEADQYPYTMTSDPIDLFANSSPGNFCAEIRVTKCDGPFLADGTCTHADPAVIHTVVHADGYNVSCALKDTALRALQRSVELQY